MKNINTPTAIVIGALIIAVSIIIVATKDPLAKCMDKVVAGGHNSAVAAWVISFPVLYLVHLEKNLFFDKGYFNYNSKL